VNIGESFGWLTVTKLLGPRGGVVRALCQCGTVCELPRHRLASGNTKSCGCWKIAAPKLNFTTHGEVKLIDGKRIATPEYRSWQMMKDRCQNIANKNYADYGGRGITICPEWGSFEQFLTDMGRRPTPLYTLERSNNNLGYSAANCCWATRKEQARNRRYATIHAWELAESMGVKVMSAHHYIWQVRAKDKGDVRWFSLSPEKERIVREFIGGY